MFVLLLLILLIAIAKNCIAQEIYDTSEYKIEVQDTINKYEVFQDGFEIGSIVSSILITIIMNSYIPIMTGFIIIITERTIFISIRYVKYSKRNKDYIHI